jgi:hypothetical protein
MATLESEHEVSLKENPEPNTWTLAPALASDGLTVIDMAAVVRVKIAEAESPVGLPVSVIV